jgi:hypothetical protein
VILENETGKEVGRISRYYYSKAYFEDIGKINRIFELIIKGINEK